MEIEYIIFYFILITVCWGALLPFPPRHCHTLLICVHSTTQ